uniref:actin nucleation-promoting factor WAS-like n=1 Tax=Nyctereutes procyonoides TaxID=34880 RepID=UPI00244444A1|nr:actin nucleation-promoting factor WAS-like [Nyctereutes procyonoides]
MAPARAQNTGAGPAPARTRKSGGGGGAGGGAELPQHADPRPPPVPQSLSWAAVRVPWGLPAARRPRPPRRPRRPLREPPAAPASRVPGRQRGLWSWAARLGLCAGAERPPSWGTSEAARTPCLPPAPRLPPAASRALGVPGREGTGGLILSHPRVPLLAGGPAPSLAAPVTAEVTS